MHVPADAKTVAIQYFGHFAGTETLVYQRIGGLQQQLIRHDGLAQVSDKTTHDQQLSPN
jgi:hypothetical protein